VVGGAPADTVLLNGSGNVGIGTTINSSNLDVAGSEKIWNKGSTDAKLLFGTDSSTFLQVDTTANLPDLVVYTSTAQRVTITSTGILGVGTATPQSGNYLVVGSTGGLQVTSTGGITTAGTVGVTSTAPTTSCLCKQFTNGFCTQLGSCT
jgi:hypothetical protein